MFTLFYDEIILLLLADDDKDERQQRTGKKEKFGGVRSMNLFWLYNILVWNSIKCILSAFLELLSLERFISMLTDCLVHKVYFELENTQATQYI